MNQQGAGYQSLSAYLVKHVNVDVPGQISFA